MPVLYYAIAKTPKVVAAICVDDDGHLCYANMGSSATDAKATMARDLAVVPQYQLTSHIPSDNLAVIHTIDQFTDVLSHPELLASIDVKYIFGTPFQRQVWDELRRVAPGTTTTYATLATTLNSHPRAVGGAVGANRLVVVVPCHRVLGSQNHLTGFRYGVGLKEHLLRKELGSTYDTTVTVSR